MEAEVAVAVAEHQHRVPHRGQLDSHPPMAHLLAEHRWRREPHSPSHKRDTQTYPRPELQTEYDKSRNERSFIFSYFNRLTDCPDRHQVVGFKTEHRFYVFLRVGDTVFCLDLTADVFN